jgi:hypothetical protein
MSPRAKPKAPQPSSAEQFARSRVMKGSAELAAAFDIHDAPPRELVRVESLPDPPDAVVPGAPAPAPDTPMNIEETCIAIFREEADELGERLKRFGIAFHPSQRQSLVDYCMALVTPGMNVSGGAVARRR